VAGQYCGVWAPELRKSECLVGRGVARIHVGGSNRERRVGNLVRGMEELRDDSESSHDFCVFCLIVSIVVLGKAGS